MIMLNILYPISFGVSLLGLILWFYYQNQPAKSKLCSTAFLGGFLVYAMTLAFADAEFTTKLSVLFRDLMVLGIVSQTFGFIRKKQAAFWSLLAVGYIFFHFFYFNFLTESFAKATSNSISTEQIEYDQEGELLLEISNGKELSSIQSILDKYNLSAERAFDPFWKDDTDLDDYFVVDVPAKHSAAISDIMNELNNSGHVDWVEPNEKITLDDPGISEGSYSNAKRNYGVNDPSINKLWGFDAMEVDKLYDLLKDVKPKRKARVYILDTGVDAKHEDIKANYKSLSATYDKDGMGHGTHCAGIAGAVSNNGVGIASFGNNNNFVEITSISVLNSFGGGTQRTIIEGIIKAADNGADVISMSLGGPSNSVRQKGYQNAIEYANKKGAIVLAAAGNSNKNAKDYSPANTPGIITVSAIDTALNRASFSNFVQDVKMGVAAPGVAIYSTIPNNKYAFFNGTSMATPYVAGLVGVMKAIKPSLTTKEAYEMLNRTGKKTNSTKETGKLIAPFEVMKELVD